MSDRRRGRAWIEVKSLVTKSVDARRAAVRSIVWLGLWWWQLFAYALRVTCVFWSDSAAAKNPEFGRVAAHAAAGEQAKDSHADSHWRSR